MFKSCSILEEWNRVWYLCDVFNDVCHTASAKEWQNLNAPNTIGIGIVIAIVLIICIVIFIIVDVSCYFINDMGITRTVCVRVCNRTRPFAKEKAMEEGER